MNVVIAMDSFKESISSLQAGSAAAEGIKRVFPDAESTIIPMADGGEGTTEALIHSTGGCLEQVEVTDLLGRKRLCTYGILPDGTAVIEAAAAAGLHLLQQEERNPLRTTTYGLGEMIADAIRKGCRSFLIGLGGSGTNDGGVGMLQALGFHFADIEGNPVPSGAEGLRKICAISLENTLPELAQCNFQIACDVSNPLYGVNGCSAVFGPQKGADDAMVKEMDRWMEHFAEIVKAVLPCSNPDYPGAGAAGGLGFSLLSFLDAKLLRGIELVMRYCGAEVCISSADLVITGEGRLDGQTGMGKAPYGIAQLAKKHGKPVVALCGSLGPDAALCKSYGIDACFSIQKAPCSLEDAIRNGEKNLADTAEQVFRLIRSIK